MTVFRGHGRPLQFLLVYPNEFDKRLLYMARPESVKLWWTLFIQECCSGKGGRIEGAESWGDVEWGLFHTTKLAIDQLVSDGLGGWNSGDFLPYKLDWILHAEESVELRSAAGSQGGKITAERRRQLKKMAEFSSPPAPTLYPSTAAAPLPVSLQQPSSHVQAIREEKRRGEKRKVHKKTVQDKELSPTAGAVRVRVWDSRDELEELLRSEPDWEEFNRLMSHEIGPEERSDLLERMLVARGYTDVPRAMRLLIIRDDDEDAV